MEEDGSEEAPELPVFDLLRVLGAEFDQRFLRWTCTDRMNIHSSGRKEQKHITLERETNGKTTE